VSTPQAEIGGDWRRSSHKKETTTSRNNAIAGGRARGHPGVDSGRAGLERNVLNAERWLGGHAVKIVDGTGISMPDTPENQALWPQPSAQQAGCASR